MQFPYACACHRAWLVLLPAVVGLLCVPGAQAQGFGPGDKNLGLGLGFGGNYSENSSFTAQTPLFGLSYEQGVMDLGPGTLGLGGFLGYKSLSSEILSSALVYTYDLQWTYFIVGVLSTWHYNQWHGVEKLDTYAGIIVSYNAVRYTDNTTYPVGVPQPTYDVDSELGLTGYLGARYYFSDQFGAHAELGYGISVLTLGVSFQL